MNQVSMKRIRMAVISVCSLLVVLLFTACAGVAGNASAGTITGSVQSVNAAAHSVTLNVNGQQITVSSLTDQQIAALQSQVGKTYTIQVQGAQGNSNTYTITNGTSPTENDNGTPTVNTGNDNQQTGNNAPGNLSFIGKVQSASNGSVVVSMPDGQTLTVAVNGQTDQSDFNGSQPSVGQTIKVKALANADGSFTASKFSQTDNNDLQDQQKLNTVDFQGLTTQAVGSNGSISFKVGSKSYTFTIGPNTEVKDFNGAQSIGANQAIKLEALYSGSSATVVQISNGNN